MNEKIFMLLLEKQYFSPPFIIYNSPLKRSWNTAFLWPLTFKEISNNLHSFPSQRQKFYVNSSNRTYKALHCTLKKQGSVQTLQDKEGVWNGQLTRHHLLKQAQLTNCSEITWKQLPPLTPPHSMCP